MLSSESAWRLNRRSGISFWNTATWVVAAFAIPALATQAVYEQQHAVSPIVDAGATEIFQVYRPPLVPIAPTSSPHDDFSGEACSATLFTHEFVNSWGQPAVAQYSPPPEACSWNTVYFHLHTTSKGRQYDRLAFLFFNDTELWRTSTAEPTPNGIYFTYTKDLTHFDALLREKGTLVFDMGNTVTDLLTGTFTVTLSAHYFKLDLPPQQKPADVVAPVSKMQGSYGQPSHFNLPNDLAQAKLSVPGNVKKAVLSVIASGNADEEFWYTNVPDNLANSFPNTTLFGHSSYREVQVYVDGIMVDVIMPTPTIYTGGINPGLWKPIVCPYAYDLWEAHVDITPWVAGKSEVVVELRVEGMTNTAQGLVIGGGIGQNWYVSGRAFFWTDPDTPQLAASEYQVIIDPPSVKFSFQVDGTGEEKIASFRAIVRRKISVLRDFGQGIIHWKKEQNYEIESALLANGNNQTLSTDTFIVEAAEIKVQGGYSSPQTDRVAIRNEDFKLLVNSSYITFADKSFYLYGKVNSFYMNEGPESTLLTDKSPLFLNAISRDELGVRRSHDYKSVDDSSSYFSAAQGSNKTSWIAGSSHQEQKYNILGNAFLTDRTVKDYGRKVDSIYPQLTKDFQILNGVPIKDFTIPVATTGRKSQQVEIGPDEVLCVARPRGEVCPGRQTSN
ncbi:hypothetical protein H072_1220 [Dactylellina haptotyla CBS 200.50]|uniref:Peptide N-acetyl-beta-D-glucosaminyl asparaginase amidase A N-terminal domain-containing protein n=1 Tax=Dactylellina haptotyla (strain CBS 200.50) TaxID=1284197 RepID=S8CAN0_DACHA|nr:hypothetical protein H072_1220 [Dactylellina haptotyla CBS 200.50]